MYLQFICNRGTMGSESEDTMNPTTSYTITNDDGEEYQIELPTRFGVCGRCEGHGTHLHEAIGEHAYTPEEFRESFDDEEAAEYFRRGGRYDVQCSVCHGDRVVPVIDEAACSTAEQQQALRDLEREEMDAYRDNAERDAERRFGC